MTTNVQKDKILIVEDSPEVSRMYERAFRFHGHEVALSYDGESAQRELSTMKDVPAAIVLDVKLPRMSGTDLLLDIRKNPRFAEVPVVILTNSFYKEDRDRFLSAGAALYLIKIEHQAKDIVEKVEELIHRPEGQTNVTEGKV